MLVIQNNYLKATFLRQGAELRSLVEKKSGKELMWQADPTYWAKTSPVLFPIVGALKDNKYSFEDKEYILNRHGFARDMDFEIVEYQQNQIIFRVTDTKKTWTHYPFSFELFIKYSLDGKKLKVDYEIINTAKDYDLWFSIGAHPAFAIDTASSKSYDDYFLIFAEDEALRLNPLTGSLLNAKTYTKKLDNSKLQLSYGLFKNDALVISSLKSKEIILKNTKDSKELKFQFSNFDYFGVWAVPEADFVCLEPWSGIADFEEHNYNFKEKKGINRLAPLTQWCAQWSVETG